MRMSFGLEQRLAQKQILAPRMIQSMEILQLPLQALESRIEQEIIENPLLEARERDPDIPREHVDRENPDSPTTEERELVVDESKNQSDDFERLLEMDQEWPGHFDDGPRRSAGEIAEEGDRKLDAMANIVNRHESLQDFLEDQLGELEVPTLIRQLAIRIISSLDHNGYLTASLGDLLPADANEEEKAAVSEALLVVQALDPAGVGARSLRECLLLQITPDLHYAEELKVLISDHLDDLKDNRLPAIRKKTGFTIEHIQEVWEQLRKLNPKPGARFSEEFAPTVNPDIVVDRLDDGSFKVRMEEGRIPRLRISKYYRQRLLSGEATPEEREFIKKKINSAQWLIESIQQRRSTLTRVAQAIVDYQKSFLEYGPEYIEPLKMQQIADQVGVHVTTISRAVDDKFIQTPRGIYPLKRFFVGGTKSDAGDDIAWDAIRNKLQEVVDQENKSNPLSDDELVDELKKHGLTVARRTVTKYRQKMDIPSSRQRRDWSK
ncbi:MAG: RNA polymerase factor sigma-54 [Planctomycetota bacterium]|nr:RNA polymerase factor sigma-54 [Planctomycetota bacterium]